MKTEVSFTTDSVEHIAGLANLNVTNREKKALAKGFNETLKVVDKLKYINVENVEPTSQVTGLTNVFREDIVDTDRMLTQEDALINARSIYKGYFVVNRVLDQ